MRLAQVARKLSITTEDIVDFLEIRGVSIEKESNTKLEEDALKLLYTHFEVEEEAPADAKADKVEESLEEENHHGSIDSKEELDQKVVSAQQEEENDAPELSLISDDSTIEENEKLEKKPSKTVEELLSESDEQANEEVVIKAPKVELKGLNVLGKIELPEPKLKAEPKDAEEEPKARKSKPTVKGKKAQAPKRKAELSPAEIRKRKAEREARKRVQIEKEKKKKREQFYKDKILKPQQKRQKAKPKRKNIKAEQDVSNVSRQPKTLLGRFWRWLNT
jgi:hypothetical protein